jgi:branched-subunit amino acid aminotransferase/4-amino-4-deoxychorismate lyase
MIKKDIFVNDLKSYDEILLVGSGKGIASVKTIKQIGWKRKNLKQFKILSKYYNSITNKCPPYRLI